MIGIANSGHQTQYTVGRVKPGVLLLRYKYLSTLGDDGGMLGAIPKALFQNFIIAP
jgi:hypothetical protein